MFKNPKYSKSWNVNNANKPALNCLRKDGYLEGGIFYKLFLAHRVCFAIYYGFWPKEVDHINHIKTDNRIVNLREVDRQGNCKNRPLACNNRSGITGVCWYKKRNKWQSSIKINQKSIYLGMFKDINDAIKIRQQAEIEYNFHKNHGN